MKGKLLFLFLIFSNICFSQKQHTISGYVQEESSGENLIGVTIYEKESLKGTVSNQYGFYSLTLTEGEYEIIYSFVGLNSSTKQINLNKDIRMNISLSAANIITEEITIKSERQDKNVASSNMSQVKMQVNNIKKLPVILGEVDVLKSAQLLPGIQSGGEGN